MKHVPCKGGHRHSKPIGSASIIFFPTEPFLPSPVVLCLVVKALNTMVKPSGLVACINTYMGSNHAKAGIINYKSLANAAVRPSEDGK